MRVHIFFYMLTVMTILAHQVKSQDKIEYRHLVSTGPDYVPDLELSLDPIKMHRMEKKLQHKVKLKMDTSVAINAVNFKEKFKDYIMENAYYILVRSQSALDFIQNEYLYISRVQSYIEDGFAVEFFGVEGAKEFEQAYRDQDRLYKLPQDKMLMIMYFGFSLSRVQIFKMEETEESITFYFHDGIRYSKAAPEDYPDISYWELTKTDKLLEFFFCPLEVDRDFNRVPIPGTEKIKCDKGKKVIFAKRVSK